MSATVGGATVTGVDVDTIGEMTERMDDAIIRPRGIAEGLGHVLNSCLGGTDPSDLLALLLTDMRSEVAALEKQSADLAEVWRRGKLDLDEQEHEQDQLHALAPRVYQRAHR